MKGGLALPIWGGQGEVLSESTGSSEAIAIWHFRSSYVSSGRLSYFCSYRGEGASTGFVGHTAAAYISSWSRRSYELPGDYDEHGKDAS